MSQNIDERILSMQFDNRKFEKNLQKTSKSLEEFEEQLQFKDAGKGFDRLTEAANNFNVDGVLDTLDQIKGKFSVLETVVQTFVRRAASDMYNWAKGMAKSLSIDQITSGFSKYETNVRSVNTIAVATNKSVEEVNEALKRLLWYTDETSASYTDMVNNIGKFTSQKVELDDAIQAMEGIANLSYLSGQGINEASRAMYNFSQALGVGSVKLMDWRSIENANMATAEFKQTIIDTAIELGTLMTGGRTKRGTTVTAQNFSSTLAEGWFNKDVLLKVLKKYGSYGDMLYEYMAENADVDTASEAMAKLGAAGDELGYKAFKAAQQARTFTDAIEATKDAVSSGWLQTFQYIIGDTNEATELFTDLANALWDVFAAGGEARNELLELWHDNEGRATLLEGIYSALEGISQAATAIKDAFTGMFPEFTVDHLLGISNAVKEFGDRLKETYWYMDVMTNKTVETISFRYEVETNFKEAFERGAKGDEVKELQQWLTDQGYGDLLGDAAVDGIFGPKTEAALKKFQQDAGLAVTGVYDEATHKSLGEAMFGDEQVTQISHVMEAVDRIYSPALKPLAKIAEGLGAVGNLARRFGLTMWQGLQGTFEAFQPLVDVFLDIGGAISDFFIAVDSGEGSTTFFEKLSELLGVFNGALATGIQWVANLLRALFLGPGSIEDGNEKFKIFAEWIEKVKNLISNSGIGKWFKNLGNSFTAFVDSVKSKGFIAAIKEKLVQMWTDVKEYFTSGQFASDVKKFFGNLKFSFMNFLAEILTADEADDPQKRAAHMTKIKERFVYIFNKIKAFFVSIKKKIDEIVAQIKASPAYQWIEEKFNQAKEGLLNFFSSLFNKDDEQKADNAESKVSILERIKNVWETVKSAVVSFFTSIFGGGEGENVESSAEKAEEKVSVLERIKTIWEKVKATIVGFFSSIFGSKEESEEKKATKTTKNVDKKLSFIQTLKAFWKAFTDATGDTWETMGLGFSTIGKILAKLIQWAPFLLAIGTVVFIIVKVIGSLGAIASITENIRGIVTKSPIVSKKDNNKFLKLGASILMIAAAIGVVAYAVGTLAKLNTGELVQGGIAIVVIAGVLVGVIAALDAIKIDGKNMFKNAGAMLLVAGAVTLIAAAMYIIGKTDAKTLIKGGIIVGIIMLVLKAFIKSLNKTGDTNINIKGLIEVAAAVAILGVIAWLLGNADTKKLAKGIAAIWLLLLALKVFVKGVSKVGNGTVNIKGIIAIAGAIAILAGVAILLGIMPTRTLIKGVAAVGALMLLLFVFTLLENRVAKIGNVKISGLVSMAAAIGILVLCVAALGLMPKNSLKRGVTAIIMIGVVMAGLMAVSALMRKFDVKVGPILAIAGIIAILVGCMVLLATLPVDQLDAASRAMVALSGTVAIIAGMTILTSKFGGSIGNMAKSATGIGVAFAIVVAIAAAVLTGLGSLEKLGEGNYLSSRIEAGGQVLKSIANALNIFDDPLTTVEAMAGALAVFTLDGYIGPDKTVIGAAAVGAAFTIAVGFATVITAGLGEINEAGGERSLIQDVEDGGRVLKAIAEALNVFDFATPMDQLLAVAGIIAGFTAVGYLGAGQVILGATAVGAAFTIAVGIATAVTAGLGEINAAGGEDVLVHDVEDGGRVLQAVAEAINMFGFEEPMDQLVAAAGIIAGFTAVGYLGSAQVILGAAAVGAAFAIAVAIATAVTAGLGEINSAGGERTLVDAVEEGGKVLKAVANAVNVFGFEDPMDMLITAAGIFAGFGLTGALGGLNMVIGSAAIGAAFGIIAAIATAVIGGLGKLDEWSEGELVDSITRGGSVLTAVGGALGGFVSGFKAMMGSNDEAAGEISEDSLENLKELADTGITKEDLDPALDVMSSVADFMNELGGNKYKNLERTPSWVGSLFGTDTAFNTVLKGVSDAVSVFSDEGLLQKLPLISESRSLLTNGFQDITELMEIVAKFMDKLGKDYTHMDKEAGVFARLIGEETAFSTVLHGIASAVLTFTSDISVFTGKVKQEGEEETTLIDALTDMPEITEVTTGKLDGVLGLMDQVAKFMNDLGAYEDLEKEHGALAAAFLDKTSFQTVLNGVASTIGVFYTKKSQLENMPEMTPGVQAKFAGIILSMTQIATFMAALGNMEIEKEPSWFASWFSDRTTFQTVVEGVVTSVTSFSRVNADLRSITFDEDTLEKFTKIMGALSQVTVLLGQTSAITRGDFALSDLDLFNFLDHLEAHLLDFGEISEDPNFDSFVSATTAIASGYTSVLNAITSLSKFVNNKKLLTDLTTYYNMLIDGLIESDESVIDQLPTVVQAINDGLIDADISSSLDGPVGAAADRVRTYYSQFFTAGGYLVDGLIAGLKTPSKVAAVGQATAALGTKALSGFAGAVDLGSPSRIMYQYGAWMDEGLANGLKDYSDSAVSQATKTASRVLAAVSSTLAEDDDLSPTITPVLDLSEVSSEASKIGRIFGSSYGVNTSTKIANSTFGKGGYAEKATNTTTGVISSITGVRDEVSTLKEAMKNLKVVMKNGALVGAIGPDMDRYLGHRAAVEKRRG